jgi:hypothetical protein
VFVVTTAVKLPEAVGWLVSLTVSVAAVAAVTVPAAPLLKLTVLFAAVVSKPTPVIVSVVARAATSVTALVTTGFTEATSTAVPLVTPFDATIAVRLPALGLVLSATVSDVADAAVTFPIAPLLKVTVFWLGVVLKPVPAMIIEAALAARVAELAVTVGAVEVATTCATWTAVPLDTLLVVTEPLRAPTAAGPLVSSTVSEVVDATVTLPVAVPVNVTVLLLATGLKPKPLMTRLVPLSDMLLELAVTTGLIVAT